MTYSTQSAFLSNLIYDDGRVNQGAADTKARYVGPNGSLWEIKAFRESSSGYQGAIFKNVDTGEVMLVNRGTEIGVLGGARPTAFEALKDLITDAQMGVGALPGQFLVAEELRREAQRIADDSGSALKITGHSLGGSISQYLGAKYGGCKNFCVNGQQAGNCRIARSDDDRSEERCTQGVAGQPVG
jgi:putative lipase involved disintegration of autophagic bodies